MISNDFEKDNHIKNFRISRNISSGNAFNQPILTADINSTESDNENKFKRDDQVPKSFKDRYSIENENSYSIFSNDSGTKKCPEYYANSSSTDTNTDSTESSNEKNPAVNKDNILNFDDFYSMENKSDSDDSFGLNSTSKNENPRKYYLQQNFPNIPKQILTIDDEIEDEIHISEPSADEKETFPYKPSQEKGKSGDTKDCPQKIDANDLTFFTSNQTYMSNIRIEKEEVPIKEPQKVRDTARKPVKTNPKSKRRLTPEEIHAIRMQQLKQYAIGLYHLDDPSINMTDDEYDELIPLLNEERRKHISERNFTEGDKMNKVINTVIQDHEKKKKQELQQQEYSKYLKQHQLFLDSLKKFDQETDEIIEKIEKKNIELTEELRKKHEKELSDHYDKWMSDAKMRQYNHASQRLLNERKTVECLLNQCRFNEAKSIQASIDEMEKEEEKIAAAQMQHDYEESLNALNEKQKNEENFLRQKCDMKITQIQQRRKIERMTFMNKEKKFVKMKEQVSSPDKLWNAMQNQRINQIYKDPKKKIVLPPRIQQQQQQQQQLRERQWRQKDAMSRRRNEGKSLPPIENPQKEQTKTIQQANLRLPGTARQPTTSTVIKLPPLKIKKPTARKSRLSHSVR